MADPESKQKRRDKLKRDTKRRKGGNGRRIEPYQREKRWDREAA